MQFLSPRLHHVMNFSFPGKSRAKNQPCEFNSTNYRNVARVIWRCNAVTEDDLQGAPATRSDTWWEKSAHEALKVAKKNRIETPPVLTSKSYSRDRFSLLVPLQQYAWEFDYINFGGFCRGFSGRIFRAIFSPLGTFLPQ